MNVSVLQKREGVRRIPESIFSEFKQTVSQYLAKLDYPISQDESWRKFPIQQLNLSDLTSNHKVQEVDKNSFDAEPPIRDEDTVRINELLSSLLEDAKENYFSLYTLLNSNDYYYIEIADDAPAESYLEWKYNLKNNQSGFVVFLVSVKKQVSAKFRESYLTSSNNDELHLLGSVSFYSVDDGAKLEILVEEQYDPNLYHFRFVSSAIGRDSVLNINSFPLGGFRRKVYYFPKLNGKGAEHCLSAVGVLRNRELADIEVKVTHNGDFTFSKVSYKAIVADKAHHIFTGNLSIPNTVKKASAHQESFNLSLNKSARAEANPKLEVMAEDVSCTHGATVGDINEEQLFYLLSRGLTLNESKSLLVSAFFEEKVLKIPFPIEIRESISDKIRAVVNGR